MSIPTFTRPETETEKQDKLYNQVMILLGDWIAQADDLDDMKRRATVIKRRCTSQPYSKNHNLLVDYASERFSENQSEGDSK